MKLLFKENKSIYTLGVELEVQMLNPANVALTPRAMDLLSEVKHPRIIKEMFLSTIELVTDVCGSIKNVESDLTDLIEQIENWGANNDVLFVSSGTHPMANFTERLIYPSDRYQELLDRNQWLIRRMAVYGLHIHIGMPNGDACISTMNRFLVDLPYFIGLSASSPFWNGTDTGLMSVRPTMYESHPTSGLPFLCKNWEEFENYYQDLLNTGSVQSMKDIWWDIRPSPGFGTIELRMCDAPTNMEELLAIAAFAQCLAKSYADEGLSEELPTRWILRENKWRALRYGLDAELIDKNDKSVKPMRQLLLEKIEVLRPCFEFFESVESIEVLRRMVTSGVSSNRQKRKFIETNSLEEVIRMNFQEFKNRKPN